MKQKLENQIKITKSLYMIRLLQILSVLILGKTEIDFLDIDSNWRLIMKY